MLGVELVGVGPVDRRHERGDVVRRLRAEIHVIGVFVHVEDEQRYRERGAVCMVRRPVIVKLPRVTIVGKYRPAGTATKSVARAFEFGFPSFVAAEPFFDQLFGIPVCQNGRGLPSFFGHPKGHYRLRPDQINHSGV